MKIQRTIPPTAAPIHFNDLLNGIAGIFLSDRYIKKIASEIKEYFGVKHVFLVSSGKAALTLILLSLKSLSSRRQVLIPAYTCFSVPSAIAKAGLSVSLCDVDPTTLDFNLDLLEKLLDERTLCVVPTHLLGLPADMDRINALCKKKGVLVVEDTAQAVGGKYNGRLLGTLGDASFFSLGRGKNITCGSGGIILTNSDPIAHALRMEYSRLRIEQPLKLIMNFFGVLGMYLLMDPLFYGLPAGLPFLKLGETKFLSDFTIHRLDGLRAGLLLNWKKRLEQSNRARCAMARNFIDRLLPGSCVIHSPSGEKTIYLRLPVMLESKKTKEKLCALSKESGFGISPMYPTAIQEIRELKDLFERVEFPSAKMVAERLVTLPVHPLVRQKDVEKICKMVNDLQDSISENVLHSTSRTIGEASA